MPMFIMRYTNKIECRGRDEVELAGEHMPAPFSDFHQSNSAAENRRLIQIKALLPAAI